MWSLEESLTRKTSAFTAMGASSEAWNFLLIIVPSLKHLVFVDGPGVFVLFLFLAEPLSGFIEVSISTAIHFCFPLVGGWFYEQSPTHFRNANCAWNFQLLNEYQFELMTESISPCKG